MSTRPRIEFDERGWCNACQWMEEKKTFDWGKREQELLTLLDEYRSKTNEFENIYIALDDFAIEADLHFSWEKMNKEGNQYGTRYYKDFDKEEQKDLISNSKEENTKKLLAYIDKILLNPYDVNIGSISINYSDMNEEYVVMKIPVSYSIKNNLIEYVVLKPSLFGGFDKIFKLHKLIKKFH